MTIGKPRVGSTSKREDGRLACIDGGCGMVIWFD